MQGIMLYFSGSGVQIFSLGMIFMLLTSPITSVLNIFKGEFEPFPTLLIVAGMITCGVALGFFFFSLELKFYVAFEPFRPIPPNPKNPERVGSPTYLPLIIPMMAYIACQGLTQVNP